MQLIDDLPEGLPRPTASGAASEHAGTPTRSRAGIDAMAERWLAIQAELTALATQRADLERDQATRLAQLDDEHDRRRQDLAARSPTDDPRAAAEQRIQQWATATAARVARIADTVARRKRALREQSEQHRTAVMAADPAEDAGAQQVRREVEILRRQLDEAIAGVTALRQRVSAADGTVVGWARSAHIALPDLPRQGKSTQPRRSGYAHLREDASGDIADLEHQLDRVRRSFAARDSRLGGMLFNQFLGALPFAIGAAVVLYLIDRPEFLPWIIAGGVLTQVLMPLHTRRQRRRYAGMLADLRQRTGTVQQTLHLLDLAARAEIDVQAPLQRHLARFSDSDQQRQAKAAAITATCDQRLHQLRERESLVRNRLERRHARHAADIRLSAERAVTERSTGRDRQHAAADQQHADTMAATQQQHVQQLQQWESRHAAVMHDAAAWAERHLTESRQRHPSWDDRRWSQWSAPADAPDTLPIGTAQHPEHPWTLPVALGFPGPAALLVRHGSDTASRTRALALVHRVALRALTAFPAGQVRLTLIDPVGLGDSFAPLLDLGAKDDTLLGGGVLSDHGRIEQGLADLIAHVEVVIRKRLRGTYATILDYNRDAGPLQEPLRLVLIADHPNGFGERASERLIALARNGARCGVHLVLLQDERQRLPASLDAEWFRRNGIALRDHDGRTLVDHPAFAAWRFDAGAAPSADLVRNLVQCVASGATAASRIEVPFSVVAPSADQRWSRSTATGLRVPIGTSGAGRVQDLELGRGTAQHVLVGGRTGSGKSTLFHVLITAAALWHHPRELELHLIDFKKGVEFRAYAAGKLPHARVIAIESDREFGLSVLRNLDDELTRRGELFRKAGAQDLAGYRSASGAEMPRILLLIDEFQEYFTDDDTIARDAALLLDRFVRQGRAFGVHVVLGSQTLGGAYALAKSSLGQMGVRIALPCNESDAHLLLHEDNDGARLLVRPGDGIYNDRAGMVEGNSPFQVCWLGDDQRNASLAAVADLAHQQQWARTQPTVVFAGDAPADLAELDLLPRRAATAPATPALSAWIGQASSLKGAALLTLPAAAGGNLLLIGQHREAAAATCTALALGFAAHQRTGWRWAVLDGDDDDGPWARQHQVLAAAIPGIGPRQGNRDAATLLRDLDAELERRRTAPAADAIVLLTFATQRLRALRPDDDLAFGATETKPAELFARILSEGPEFGIHVICWCDSLASLQRGLGRRTAAAFDQRLLFQMSAGDSSELIDRDDAARLGLHSALLASQADGRIDKIRPFSLPAPDTIRAIGDRLRQRG